MKAWDIFAHSVRLVWRNRANALRISLVLYVIYAVVQMVIAEPQEAMVSGTDETPIMGAGDAGTLFLLVILQVLVTLWIAVAWHRFVLLEEYPSGWLPQFHGGAILRYLALSLLIGLAIAFCVGVPTAIIAAFAPPLAVVAAIAGVLFAIVLGFRLAPVLPGAATGQGLGLGAAWEATRGATGTALTLAVIGLIALFVVQIPVFVIASISVALGTVAFLVVNWFVTLVSVSILTTIYGHYVEGREID